MTSAPHARIDRRSRSDAKLLFGLLFTLYALIGRGEFMSSDEGGSFNTALSLIARRSLAIAPGENVHVGRGGQHYACREPLPTLASIPPSLVGSFIGIATKSVPPCDPEATQFAKRQPNWAAFLSVMLLGPCAAALTVRWAYQFLIYEGASRRDALLLCATLGIATPLIVYSKTIFSQVFEGAWLMGALLAARVWRDEFRSTKLFQLGVFCGLGMMTRAAFAPVSVLFIVYVFAVRGWRVSFRQWRDLALLLIPMILGGSVTATVNFLRWGSPLDFGYHNTTETFQHPVLVGAAQLLFSPGRGLLWYTPLLLFVVPFGRRIFTAGRAEAWLVTSITVFYLLLYGRWYDLFGGVAWSSRFLVGLVPLWCALLGRAVQSVPRPRAWNIGMIAALVLGGLIQVVGWLRNPNSGYFDASDSSLLNGNWCMQLQLLRRDGVNDLWLTADNSTAGAYVFALLLALTPGVWAILQRIRNEKSWHVEH